MKRKKEEKELSVEEVFAIVVRNMNRPKEYLTISELAVGKCYTLSSEEEPYQSNMLQSYHALILDDEPITVELIRSFVADVENLVRSKRLLHYCVYRAYKSELESLARHAVSELGGFNEFGLLPSKWLILEKTNVGPFVVDFVDQVKVARCVFVKTRITRGNGVSSVQWVWTEFSMDVYLERDSSQYKSPKRYTDLVKSTEKYLLGTDYPIFKPVNAKDPPHTMRR